MRKLIAWTGYVFVALMVIGLCLTIFMAWRAGRPFYGENYLHQPLGTYSSALVLLMAGSIGLVRALQLLIFRKRGRQESLNPRVRGNERESA